MPLLFTLFADMVVQKFISNSTVLSPSPAAKRKQTTQVAQKELKKRAKSEEGSMGSHSGINEKKNGGEEQESSKSRGESRGVTRGQILGLRSAGTFKSEVEGLRNAKTNDIRRGESE